MGDDNCSYLSCEEDGDDYVEDYDQGYDDDGCVQEKDDEDEYDDGTANNSSSCKVITRESLMAAQKKDLEAVMDFLSVKEHHARTLLIHFSWDTFKIVDTLSDKGKEWLFAIAGVPMATDFNLPSSHSAVEVTCEICFDDIPVYETTTMDCGHCFCNNCWRGHFIVKINEGKSRRITCMAHKCMAICDEGSIRSLVGAQDPGLAEKFDRFLLESYIEDNKLVQWCPSIPHCGNAIRVGIDEYCEVECACGLQFCFACLSEAHSPCSCLMWKLWMKKCADESETVNWMTANAKYCPKCHKPAEKNGGCNLVRCICGQHFCWLCGGATGPAHTWTSIEGHTCGRFKKEEVKKVEEARKQLFRYTHYYSRFKAHIDSLKAETKLKETVQEKLMKLAANNPEDTNQFSWLGEGMHRLSRSRRILSYSYPFAYFMFGDELFNEITQEEREIKQNLFEDHQQQLEANIEKLSKYLEEDFSGYSTVDLYPKKMQITALTALIDKFCKELYRFIENDINMLHRETHIIASYKSKGVDKASTLVEEQEG